MWRVVVFLLLLIMWVRSHGRHRARLISSSSLICQSPGSTVINTKCSLSLSPCESLSLSVCVTQSVCFAVITTKCSLSVTVLYNGFWIIRPHLSLSLCVLLITLSLFLLKLHTLKTDECDEPQRLSSSSVWLSAPQTLTPSCFHLLTPDWDKTLWTRI